MDWFARRFVKASLAWFGLGVTLGLCMAVHPSFIIYRPVHLHLNLLGFVTMMIFGVAYHVLPRFTGHPLHNARMAGVHWWVSNVGLALFATGLALQPHPATPSVAFLAAGGSLSALGAYLFIYNLWRTIDGRPLPRAVPRAMAPVSDRQPVPLTSRSR